MTGKTTVPEPRKKAWLFRGLTFYACATLAMLCTSSLVHAVSFSISPTTSTTGTFVLRFSSNSRSYVFFVETTDGGESIIHSISDTPYSGSAAVSKPNGTYRYRLKYCYSYTSGSPGGCTLSSERTVVVNRASASSAVDMRYSYDALGRLSEVRENGAAERTYCYDDAGNRVAVVEGSVTGGGCAALQPISAPTGLSFYSHQGGGYNVYWNAVQGATRYELKLDNNELPVIDGGDTTFFATHSGRPVWIQACNEFTCSAKAYY